MINIIAVIAIIAFPFGIIWKAFEIGFQAGCGYVDVISEEIKKKKNENK